MHMIKLWIILFIIISPCAQAFNWNSCRYGLPGGSQFFGLSTSSTQFFSSWGGCAMIGMASHDRKVFIAHNIDQMQNDSSRGQGEYLSTYANLSGCSGDATKKLASTLQRNMTDVFGSELDNSPEKTYYQIELLISKDPELSVSCKPKT